jgi:PTS system mannose-specific IIA component
MQRILIASHGHFASGLKSSIEILTGMGEQISTIDAYVDDSDYTTQITAFIAQADTPAVIFTDLKGGSVNQKVMLAAAGKTDLYIISQMNLAIILAVLLDPAPLSAAHLDELIAQSQVERIELTASADESDADFLS